MAAGSQEEKGIWALLVTHPITTTKKNIKTFTIVKYSKENHPQWNININLTINKQSPIRLVNTVINPESKLEELL